MNRTVLGLVVLAALGLSLPVLAAKQKANPERGKELYAECSGCHAPQEDVVGPRHCGVFGRPAASVPNYAYSEAMRSSGITWDEKQLDAFLMSPISYVSGTNMGYAGIYDVQDRMDLIAYLKQLSADPAVCPK